MYVTEFLNQYHDFILQHTFKMNWLSFNLVTFLCVALFCVTIHAEESKETGDDKKNEELFIPTHEWQIVREGKEVNR